MSNNNKMPARFSPEAAVALCREHFSISGSATVLPGELDHNYKIDTGQASFILKISRPGMDAAYLDYQEQLLLHLQRHNNGTVCPQLMPAANGGFSFTVTDAEGHVRSVRLLQWVPGRLWSSVRPKTETLLHSLGRVCGGITAMLQHFSHTAAGRVFDWDITQAAWTYPHLYLFTQEQRQCVLFFTQRFDALQETYMQLRKSVVHNDANDNNIIVSNNLMHPLAETVIDYGDAVHTQTVNDVAVALAYAIMDKPDPLAAALPLVKGYHESFPLQEAELELLYTLVAMRLVISVTKSAINKIKEPENQYLQVSEKPAWALLHKWAAVPPNFAHYSFRQACGFIAVPAEPYFTQWAAAQQITINDLLPGVPFNRIQQPDLGIGSSFLGNTAGFNDTAAFTAKMERLLSENPGVLWAGGWMETRPVYATAAFKTEGNNGPEYRTHHLGTDFWLPAGKAVHAVCDGEVVLCADNDIDKDYGPTVILKHTIDTDTHFYTLYGHLSRECLGRLQPGMQLKKGGLIAYLGAPHENGHWPPHLHFQIMLDLLDNEENYPGVCAPSQRDVWAALCPNPALLLHEAVTVPVQEYETLQAGRGKHLGRSLSLSYREPLTILRGYMQWLIDHTGRRYLDTVNNVAHVGHEHPRVVRAGQAQMAVLNTNTRYLHPNIVLLAEALAATLPPELSVIHFVNSGSEANELAMRMATTVTGQKDMIALEHGYHGNTTGCISISSYKFDGKGGGGKPPHTHIVPLPDSFRGRHRGAYNETGMAYAAYVQTAIDEIQAAGRNVCAFIAESIVSCGGQIVLPDNYLKTAYAAVRQAGGVCIADEVQTGFGRAGRAFWGFELQDVTPDIVTMGKPFGNGHPLAAVACTEQVAAAFANGMEYFNTFGGNPVSCAIGLEVLRVIQEERLQQNALAVGEYLKAEFVRLQQQYPLIGHVRGEGLFLGVELVEDGRIPATDKTAYIANRMKTLGILMSVDGPQNNVLKIKPPLCFNHENANELLERFEQILQEDFVK